MTRDVFFQLNIIVEITFLFRDRDHPVAVQSPFFRTPSPLRHFWILIIQRSFSVAKRVLIYDA